MKARLLTLSLATALGLGVAGCEADSPVGDPGIEPDTETGAPADTNDDGGIY